MMLKPITSEKAVKLIDVDNTLVFEVPRTETKTTIKSYIEKVLTVKVQGVRTHIHNNKKYAYVKLAATHPAIDVATKLGLV